MGHGSGSTGRPYVARRCSRSRWHPHFAGLEMAFTAEVMSFFLTTERGGWTCLSAMGHKATRVPKRPPKGCGRGYLMRWESYLRPSYTTVTSTYVTFVHTAARPRFGPSSEGIQERSLEPLWVRWIPAQLCGSLAVVIQGSTVHKGSLSTAIRGGVASSRSS